ncbi:hypothetical protein CHS0354_016094 [Potamilus streckersoni]|uniref:Uncharacterized protein n=1 Tax=Potamilus streckersoni TaxID=2493646 RepID=A0AAE0T0W1_9BIVA|nr:hypothetical protein CHS0354_016094 [Potamilus streckersoni]
MVESGTKAERVKSLLSSFVCDYDKNERERNGVEQSSKDKQKSHTADYRDRDSYYDRVDSYSSLTWLAKPLEFSPLVCARYGWKNIEEDLLQCVNCQAYLSGELPCAADSIVYQESCKHLRNRLTTAHEKLCVWSTNPNPDYFSKVVLYNRKELLADFLRRLESLHAVEKHLPVCISTTIQKQGVEDEHISKLSCKLHEESSHDEEKMRRTYHENCILLAICGWRTSDLLKDVLMCQYCRRKVGLWNYTEHVNGHNGVAETTSSNDVTLENGEPSPKKQKLGREKIDPIMEHKYWCPWIEKSTTSSVLHPQHNSQSPNRSFDSSSSSIKSHEPVWMICLKLLYPSVFNESDTSISACMKQSSPVDGLRYFRSVLKDCTSPESKRKQQNST